MADRWTQEKGAPMSRDAARALARYQTIRPRLPQVDFAPVPPRRLSGLAELAAGHDAVLLDAYGVLNRGEAPIPGAAAGVAALRAAGLAVRVVTNGASYPRARAQARLAGMGFDFALSEIITSRDTALAALPPGGPGGRPWGLMGPADGDHPDLAPWPHLWLADDPEPYAVAGAFLLLGTIGWTPVRQALLRAALRGQPRPLWLANPDLVSPAEHGLVEEPGSLAHRLADETGAPILGFGKPYGAIFARALASLPGVARDRVVMVGDTLHTDILGGRAAGLRTALVTGHGALRGLDAAQAMASSAIWPDFVMDGP